MSRPCSAIVAIARSVAGHASSTRVPADVTSAATPAAASRRSRSAAAIGDRHWFAVHTTRMRAGGPMPGVYGAASDPNGAAATRGRASVTGGYGAASDPNGAAATRGRASATGGYGAASDPNGAPGTRGRPEG